MTRQQTNYFDRNDFPQEQYTPTSQAGQSQPVTMLRRIGSTNYRVTIHFSDSSRETMNDKILRMAKSEVLGKCG
jgi:hypothetical protein